MEKEVCSVCDGNDYLYVDGIVEQCPLCTALGKLYEPQEVENEERTEAVYSSYS